MNTLAVIAVVAAAAGLSGGLVFFGSLRWVAGRVTGASIPWARVALVQALRFAGLVLLLWACARHGGVSLLAAAAGVIGARVLLVAASRRACP